MMVGFFDVAVEGNIDKKKFFERSSNLDKRSNRTEPKKSEPTRNGNPQRIR